jgi:hypothetical protein
MEPRRQLRERFIGDVRFIGDGSTGTPLYATDPSKGSENLHALGRELIARAGLDASNAAAGFA